MKIFLIGLPGSGKSTLGKSLAQVLGIDFMDLDAEIEKISGKPVADVFKYHGEDYFREKEAQVLRTTIERSKAFVMATGGGAPCFHKGIDVMNEAGTTIFLDVPVAVIAARMSQEEKSLRPLLPEKNSDVVRTLQNLYQQRSEYYSQTKFVLKGPEITVQDILEKIK